MGHRVSGIHRFILANKHGFVLFTFWVCECRALVVMHSLFDWFLCPYSLFFFLFFFICLIGMLSCPQEYCTYIVGGNSGPSAGCCEFLLNAIGEKASIT